MCDINNNNIWHSFISTHWWLDVCLNSHLISVECVTLTIMIIFGIVSFGHSVCLYVCGVWSSACACVCVRVCVCDISRPTCCWKQFWICGIWLLQKGVFLYKKKACIKLKKFVNKIIRLVLLMPLSVAQTYSCHSVSPWCLATVVESWTVWLCHIMIPIVNVS
jgi:hypothetical protein